ncbi:MAG: anhydro-N-acetylmuramic acid kinase [Gammaproteobacteria bacterium]
MNKVFIGLMTGTSADSLDLAAVCFSATDFQVIGLKNYEIPNQIKIQVLENTRSKELDQSSIQELDINLSKFLADSIQEFIISLSLDNDQIGAIGSHGQTIKHEPNAELPYSLQIGNPQLISNKLKIKTIGNFRDNDIEAGGQGAPLSPIFHKEVFASENEERIIINIGGITNISVVGSSNLIGFDTGPGNCLIDAWTRLNKKSNYDDKGNWAKSGKINQDLLAIMISDDYFSLQYPKSTGPDYFSLNWISNCLSKVGYKIEAIDIQTTLTELTALSLARSIEKLKLLNNEIYLCGGGVHNDYLLSRISYRLEKSLSTTAELGIDPDYLEAICFAWLAYKRVNDVRFNMTEITGSKGEVYLGKIYNPIK